MSCVGTTPKTLNMHLRDVAYKGIDFSPLLPAGATLTGTPTIAILPITGLTATSPAVTAAAFSDADDNVLPIAIGEGVIALFNPSIAGDYAVTVECNTSIAGEHLSAEVTISVGGT